MSRVFMRSAAGLLVAAAAAVGCARDAVSPASASMSVAGYEGAPVVLAWQEQARALVGAHNFNALQAGRVYAAVSVAQHRAVRAVDERSRAAADDDGGEENEDLLGAHSLGMRRV